MGTNSSGTARRSDLHDDLVVANRILVNQGVLDAFGHVSMRRAPGEDAFVLSRNLAPGLVTSTDLVDYDLDGASEDTRTPYLERFIHAEVNAQAQAQALALGSPTYLTPEEGTTADRSISGQVDRAWGVWRDQVQATIDASQGETS